MDNKNLSGVRIENFQSHSDTYIPLTPGLNLLIGTSNIGKSAVQRAFQMVAHNEPPNQTYVRFGAREARVTLFYDDGTEILRKKSDKENTYELTLPNGTKLEPFTKVNRDVPYPVRECMGFPPEDKEIGPLSIVDQLAPLFLTSLTSTELPRMLSRLLKIDDYEVAGQLAGKRAKQYDKTIKQLIDQVGRVDYDLMSYDTLETEIAANDDLDQRLSAIEDRELALRSMIELSMEYERIMQEGKNAATTLKTIASQRTTLDGLPALRARCDRVESMRSIINSLEQIEIESTEHQHELEKLNRVRTVVSTDSIAEFKKREERILGMKTLAQSYETVMQEGSSTHKALKQVEADLTTARTKIHELKERLRSLGLLCDACGQIIGRGN